MKIKDILDRSKPITVHDDDTLSLALQAMLWSEVRHLPVLRDDKLVGVLSERDVLAHNARRGPAGRGTRCTRS